MIDLKDEFLKTLKNKRYKLFLENKEQFKEFCVLAHSLGIHHRYRTTLFESIATGTFISEHDNYIRIYPNGLNITLDLFNLAMGRFDIKISVKELKVIYNNLLPTKVIVI